MGCKISIKYIIAKWVLWKGILKFEKLIKMELIDLIGSDIHN